MNAFEKSKYYDNPIHSLNGRFLCTYSGSIAGKDYNVLESFGTDGKIAFSIGDKLRVYEKFANKINDKNGTLCSFSEKELLDSGRDLLTEHFISKDFTFEDIKGVLYPEFSDGYICLGYHTSPRTFTVRDNGDIYFQADFSRTSPASPAFSPKELGAPDDMKPRLSFAGGTVPVLFADFDLGDDSKLELMYCVGQGDCDFEYGVWIRAIKTEKGEATEIKYLNAGCCNVGRRLDVDEITFMECLAGIFAHYEKISDSSAEFNIPEPELSRVFKSALMTSDTLINGFQPKYGNMFYSLESHNNFPPNFIMSLYTYAMTGLTRKARLMTEHFFENCVDDFGRIIYRQGDTQFYGYSGSEIGQLMWVIRRSFDISKSSFISEYTPILCKMADNLLSFAAESEDIPGVMLIHMCAEADTNGRIYDYIQNTMWAVRGLEALCDILEANESDPLRYKKFADVFRESIKTVCEKLSVESEFGPLVPFQLQYTPTPLTLSRCRDTAYHVENDYLEAYLKGDTNPRNDISGEQNLLENNYANYRYYPEILSSFMLDTEYSDAIDRMRSALGGEMMCMTRFMSGIDDWPAYNNALFLLESGRREKYLMLMYSHILYHGRPDFGIYYEQVGLNGGSMRRHADSCLPSTLIPPFMIASMFCHLSSDCKRLMLCHGVPAKWFELEFSAKGIYIMGGRVDIEYRKGVLNVSLGGKASKLECVMSAPDGVKNEISLNIICE